MLRTVFGGHWINRRRIVRLRHDEVSAHCDSVLLAPTRVLLPLDLARHAGKTADSAHCEKYTIASQARSHPQGVNDNAWSFLRAAP